MSTDHNIIQLRRTGTPGKSPTTSDIHQGELAFNYADNSLWISDGTAVHQINSTSYLTTADNQPIPTSTTITNLSNNLTNNYLALAGGTLTGTVNLPSQNSGNTTTYISDVAAATQGYVNTMLTNYENTLTGAVTTITSNNLTPSVVVVSDAHGKIAVSTTTSDQVAALGNLNDIAKVVVTDGNGTAVTTANATVSELNALAALSSTKAVVTDSNGNVVSSATTAAQIGYLSTVTSDVQTQITTNNSNAVQIAGSTMTGELTLNPAVQTGTNDAATNGQVAAAITAATTDTYTGAVTTILTADLSPSLALTSDASGKVAVSSVTSTELGYVSGVTSAIQTQINGKVALTGDTLTGTLNLPVQNTGNTAAYISDVAAATQGYVDAAIQTATTATYTGAVTTILTSDLSANDVLVSDANGKVAASGTTATELGYLSGVTSSVQTQLNSKLDLSGGSMTGSIVIPTGSHISIATAATAGTDAVNLNTLQNYVANLRFREEAHARDNISTTLPDTAPLTIDGYSVSSNDRILFTNLTSGNDEVYVATITGTTVTWAAANDLARTNPNAVLGDTIIVDNGTVYGLAGYTFNGTAWVQFNGGTQVTPGVGINKSGNTISVLLGAGIAELPTNDVGIDVYASGGLFLTVDGTTSAPSNANSQLSLLLNGSTLAVDTNGLKVAAGGVTDVEINSSALGNGLQGASGVAISVKADTGITVTASGVGVDQTWADARYINTSGDTLTGNLTLAGSTYVSDLTAASQGFVNTQISALNSSYNGAVTTILTADLSPSLALTSDASGKVAVSSVTSTELGYVSGVTSAIQTQINNKVSKAGDTMTGNLVIATGAIVSITDTADTTITGDQTASVNVAALRAYVVDGGSF